MSTSQQQYLTARQVREHFGGISEMSLWRWENDPKLAFPKPIKINRLRYWKAADLSAFEARQREAVQ